MRGVGEAHQVSLGAEAFVLAGGADVVAVGLEESCFAGVAEVAAEDLGAKAFVQGRIGDGKHDLAALVEIA